MNEDVLDSGEGSSVTSDEYPLFNMSIVPHSAGILRAAWVRDKKYIIALLVFKLLEKHWNDIVQVSHNPDVRDLEYWRIRILDDPISILFSLNDITHLIDSDNHLRILHTRQMLDRTRNPNGNVQLRSDNLARLTDLQ